MKKLLSLTLSFILIISMCIPAFAEDAAHHESPRVVGTISDSYVDVPAAQSDAAKESGEDVVYYGINQIKPEDFLRLTPTTVRSTRGARASYVRLEFPGALAGSVYSDFIEHVIPAGSSVNLSISACVWSPEFYDLEIGIYNWTTAENWYVVRSGGSVYNYSHLFTGLSAGEYSVYIRNRGMSSLTTGYLLYSF